MSANNNHNHNHNHNIPIFALTGSALVLLVALCLVYLAGSPPPAQAGSMQASGGDYTMTISQVSTGEEALWILDSRSRTVGIYQYDNNEKQLMLRRIFPLDALGGLRR